MRSVLLQLRPLPKPDRGIQREREDDREREADTRDAYLMTERERERERERDERAVNGARVYSSLTHTFSRLSSLIKLCVSVMEKRSKRLGSVLYRINDTA